MENLKFLTSFEKYIYYYYVSLDIIIYDPKYAGNYNDN
jgi:hypothetical protein